MAVQQSIYINIRAAIWEQVLMEPKLVPLLVPSMVPSLVPSLVPSEVPSFIHSMYSLVPSFELCRQLFF